ncbi:DUF3592 domain-containing protein [Streptomyces roseolus]|uniref:DUF3592 domain-containing protein n=1 Tax=Streptomyces roseolus TaxID=67358 RepID=UPI001671AE41|nr:DUF3592 domain-containing protein [Streptomyces roseolus]GGR60973.1 hypothetical protein GCM10010282_62480 [Streptomyces roseolus]
MDVIRSVIAILFGSYVAWAVLSEAVEHLRGRSRLIGTTALVVERADASSRPGTVRRSTVFRVTTEDGRTFDVVSSAVTFPGPRVGSRIPVRYAPEQPWKAERTGVIAFKLWMTPPVAALGAFLVVEGVRGLL